MIDGTKVNLPTVRTVCTAVAVGWRQMIGMQFLYEIRNGGP